MYLLLGTAEYTSARARPRLRSFYSSRDRDPCRMGEVFRGAPGGTVLYLKPEVWL